MNRGGVIRERFANMTNEALHDDPTDDVIRVRRRGKSLPPQRTQMLRNTRELGGSMLLGRMAEKKVSKGGGGAEKGGGGSAEKVGKGGGGGGGGSGHHRDLRSQGQGDASSRRTSRTSTTCSCTTRDNSLPSLPQHCDSDEDFDCGGFCEELAEETDSFRTLRSSEENPFTVIRTSSQAALLNDGPMQQQISTPELGTGGCGGGTQQRRRLRDLSTTTTTTKMDELRRCSGWKSSRNLMMSDNDGDGPPRDPPGKPQSSLFGERVYSHKLADCGLRKNVRATSAKVLLDWNCSNGGIINSRPVAADDSGTWAYLPDDTTWTTCEFSGDTCRHKDRRAGPVAISPAESPEKQVLRWNSKQQLMFSFEDHILGGDSVNATADDSAAAISPEGPTEDEYFRRSFSDRLSLSFSDVVDDVEVEKEVRRSAIVVSPSTEQATKENVRWPRPNRPNRPPSLTLSDIVADADVGLSEKMMQDCRNLAFLCKAARRQNVTG